MGKQIVIGLYGKPRSGKSTIADYLKKKYGFRQYEMSGPIVKDAQKMLAAIDLKFDVRHKEDFRLLLQFLGHYRRLDNPYYWVDKVLEEEVAPPAVVAGIRYLGDVERIKQKGGRLWKISRKLAANADTAPTETQLDNYQGWDAVISNNGTLPQLYRKVDKLIAQLKSEK
ncbi:MAG: hypothetical protein Q7S31_03455 [bacterium]|nr:hypothetical protein [bacterium]